MTPPPSPPRQQQEDAVVAVALPSPPTFQAQQQQQQPYAALPLGWTTAVHPSDGRIYYHHPATGTTSWTHPNYGCPSGGEKEGKGEKYDPASSGGYSPHYPTIVGAKPVGAPQQLLLPHQEDPFAAVSKPDTHECNSMLSLVLCFPVGVFAMYHTFSVGWAWDAGRYSDAVNHARQAPKYGNFGIIVGIIFWIWFLIFRNGKNRFWEEWDFGD